MSNREKRIKNQVGVFIKKYQRKKRKGYDSNDRSYDRKVEEMIKRMSPEDLDHFLNS